MEEETEEVARSRSKSKQIEKKGKEPESLADLAKAVKGFKPKILRTRNGNASAPLSLYCAARLWKSSGLMQARTGDMDLDTTKEIVKWLKLSDLDATRAENVFKGLQAMQEPWIRGYGDKDGKWEDNVAQVMQDDHLGLGSAFFPMILLQVQRMIESSPGNAVEELKILEEKVQQWKSSNVRAQLEEKLLLKEFCVGQRSQHFPTWTGVVSAQEVRSFGARPIPQRPVAFASGGASRGAGEKSWIADAAATAAAPAPAVSPAAASGKDAPSKECTRIATFMFKRGVYKTMTTILTASALAATPVQQESPHCGWECTVQCYEFLHAKTTKRAGRANLGRARFAGSRSRGWAWWGSKQRPQI